MDISKLLTTCETSAVPYRYDLGAGRDAGISYFVDNGLTQSFLCTQDSGSRNHESLSVSEVQSGICCEGGSDTLA
jgi:hypothetical protein